MRQILLEICLFGMICAVGYAAEDCPTGWKLHESKCYYFSDENTISDWTTAESLCQQQGGHLVSLQTVDERDWVVKQLGTKARPTHWYIGLHDVNSEGDFEWSDGTGKVDDEVAYWKVNEPNNIGIENCVEIWIEKLPSLNNQRWNDVSCNAKRPYVCKRTPGNVVTCPQGWTLKNQRCYQLIGGLNEWLDADLYCRGEGATIVSIQDQTEESAVESLLSGIIKDVWIGLSDTVTPGLATWNDPSTAFGTGTYNNFQDQNMDYPYRGSTCVAMSFDLGWKWTEKRCSDENIFICERGLKAECPSGWTYLDPKCYEFVINSNRVQTWTGANKVCKGIGAGLVKIESESEETFISTALESYLVEGQREIWIGGSDIGHDDTLMWWDKTPINDQYWNDNMPTMVPGTDDCISLYTGKGNNNWETSQCFLELGYICEVPEGQHLTNNAPTVTGHCDTDWRHYNEKCYYFSRKETTQSEAVSDCTSKDAQLTSIEDENELSFIEGHLTGGSWIGLTCTSPTSCTWADGTSSSAFDNWIDNEPNGDGNCVYTTKEGQWYDNPCTNAHYHVCEKVEYPDDTQPIVIPTGEPDMEKCGGDGWFSDPQSEKCYKINLKARSWFDARAHCQQYGGELLAISTPSESDFVTAIVKEIPTQSTLWVGGTDMNGFQLGYVADGGWRWDDGSPFSFINWHSGEPNNADQAEDCMVIRTDDGKWNDIPCENYQSFLCEKTGNIQGIVGQDVTDDDCKSNEACCFKHVGVEYGGPLPDTVLSASTEKDQWFISSRGRLNTPADVVIVNGMSIGSGHGAWEPHDSDTDPWLQVDFPVHMELKGIITQGRNGLLRREEMQWTTTYKVSYSQNVDNNVWEFISDSDGNPVVFNGNHDQNTMVTNFFPRPIIARHMRCHPMEFFDRRALRLEYVGCKGSCFNNLGMSSGLITDDMITASSNQGNANQARAPIIQGECLTDNSDKGATYTGWISKTTSDLTCQDWNVQSPHVHDETAKNYPDANLVGNSCRNPNGRDRPWCYTTTESTVWEYCDVPQCPSYTPVGWSPSNPSTAEFIEVDFPDYFKVSGITIFKTASYVKTYHLKFSEDGVNYNYYMDQGGDINIFFGVDEKLSSYLDILREPISTMHIRIIPQTWQGNSPQVQFEVNGCYIEQRIGCADTGLIWKDKDQFTVECPAGCLDDRTPGPVYGTDIYTAHSSVCRAALHAGKLSNEHGGMLTVTKREGLLQYEGSYRNKIQSESYDEYDFSFMFDGLSFRCDSGWRSWSDHCYYFSPRGVRMSWQSAQSDCLSRGSNLVGINTLGENDYVNSMMMQDDRGPKVWIGMTDLEQAYYFQWVDGSKVTFTKWFLGEPNLQDDHCVQMYLIDGYWDDESCETEHPYICKKSKQYLQPATTSYPPTDGGCEKGWSAYGTSCYRVSTDEELFNYADYKCDIQGSTLVTIRNRYEQSFVHALVVSSLPPNLGFTAWIGLSANTVSDGQLQFTWRRSTEPVVYTNWGEGEPDVWLQCAFPFTYNGETYTDCTTAENPLVIFDYPWCSINSVYTGIFAYCGTDDIAQGCTYLDEKTGEWTSQYCYKQRHYVCEKDRVGYTQPVVTTLSTLGTCADGWSTTDETPYCYQFNESPDRTGRLGWIDSLNYCRTQGADLVSVHSRKDEIMLNNMVNQLGIWSYTNFWIGLSSENAQMDYEWSDGTPTDYTNWDYNQPDNINGEENCVESDYYYTYGWNDQICSALRNWICQIQKNKTPLDPPTLPPPLGNEDPACGSDGTWIRFQTEEGTNNCYLFLETESVGWAAAENNCVKRGGHLASIHAEDENEFIKSRMLRTTANDVWIGLRHMSNDQYQWSDGSLLQYDNWNPGEPNNFYDAESCVEFYAGNGGWNDDNCGTSQGYICEKDINAVTVTIPPTPPQQGNCPDGFVPYGNNCYLFGTESVTWHVAEEICGNMSDVVNFVTITNQYEQAFITSHLNSMGANAWIGLRAMYGPFVWHDENEVVYTNWGFYQPDYYSSSETCVKALAFSNDAGKWDDTYCTETNKYICDTRKSPDYPEQESTPAPSDCPKGYIKWVTGCYKIYDTPMSWDEAQATCQSDGARSNLMDIVDVYENSLYTSWMWNDITSGNKLWSGLKFDTTDQTQFYTASGWPLYYSNWAADQPNPTVTTQPSGCAYYDANGQWGVVSTTGTNSEFSCNEPLPFACKFMDMEPPTLGPTDFPIDISGTCDQNFVGYGSWCYYVEDAYYYDNTRTRFEAESECRSLGATIASFHSDEEVRAVLSIVADSYSYYNLWIGLTSDGFGGWSWDDNTAVDYLHWDVGEPNGQGTGEDCAEMYQEWDGVWNDCPCSMYKGYVCRKAKTSVVCAAVEMIDREECGFIGISETACLQQRCCYDLTTASANYSGCYKLPGDDIPTIINPPKEPSKLSGGAIFGIIFASFVILGALIGAIIYMKSPDLAKSYIPKYSKEPKKMDDIPAGFDNPVAAAESMS